MVSDVELRGAAELDRTLSNAAHELGDLTPVNEKAAQTLLDKADPRTPRDKGDLAASGGVVADAEGGTVTYDEVYAGVIHNGWADHGIDPQPWLADAAASETTALVDVYVDHISDLLDRVHGI